MGLLKSYVENPGVHASACRDSQLRHGAFVNIDESRADEVRQLLAITEKTMSHCIALSRDLARFHNALIERAAGQDLRTYYNSLPDTLRGYVELVYDYYNRPSIRFIEGLLYDSPYYVKDAQSLRVCALTSDLTRPYFLNTPRLADRREISCHWSFDDPRVDILFDLGVESQPLGYIRELLNIPADRERILRSFVTDQPVLPMSQWLEDFVRIRYFGHPGVLLECRGLSILVDPFIAPTPSEGGLERFSYNDLPQHIDFVLITHSHQDHFSLETLLRIRKKIGCLVVPKALGFLYGDISLKLMARKLGFTSVMEVDSCESIALPDGEIVAVPFLGEHSDFAHGKTGYFIRAGSQTFLFAADADCLDVGLYQNIRRSLGPIETVFIGMESVGAPLTFGYGPLLNNKPRREHDLDRRQRGCDARAALDIIEALGAVRVYNYGMGLEPWTEYVLGMQLTKESPQWQESDTFLSKALGRGVHPAERLFGKRELFLRTRKRETTSLVSQCVHADNDRVVDQRHSDAGQPRFVAVRLEGALSSDTLATCFSQFPESFPAASATPRYLHEPRIEALVDLSSALDEDRDYEAEKCFAAITQGVLTDSTNGLQGAILIRFTERDHILVLRLWFSLGDTCDSAFHATDLTSPVPREGEAPPSAVTAQYTFDVGSSLVEKLQAAAIRQKCSLPVICLTALNILLAKVTGIETKFR